MQPFILKEVYWRKTKENLQTKIQVQDTTIKIMTDTRTKSKGEIKSIQTRAQAKYLKTASLK